MQKCTSILVAEDNDDIREALEDFLRGEGYRVYGVRNGREALAVLRKLPGTALILLDMMMPVMSGWDFFEERQTRHLLANQPVVVVSALGAAAALAGKNQTLPAVGYIKKPIPLEALLETVERYCHKLPAAAPAAAAAS